MLASLDAGERRALLRLFDKTIKTAGSWAKPYWRRQVGEPGGGHSALVTSSAKATASSP